MFKFKYAKATSHLKYHTMSFYIEHTCYFPYMVYYKQTHVAKGRNLNHPKICLAPSLLLESQSFMIVKKFLLYQLWSTRLESTWTSKYVFLCVNDLKWKTLFLKLFLLDHLWSTRLKAFGPPRMCSYVSIIWKEKVYP